MAVTFGATRRPLATAATARMSSIRPLVHEPMKTCWGRMQGGHKACWGVRVLESRGGTVLKGLEARDWREEGSGVGVLAMNGCAREVANTTAASPCRWGCWRAACPVSL